jgi:cytochrome P450
MAKDIDPRHQLFDTVRATTPVVYETAYATFLLTRFADARAVLNDATMWKDADRAEPDALVRKFKPDNRPGDRDSAIGWMDNPDHARVRPPIAMALNRRVAGLRPFVEAACARRLEALAAGAGFDAMADYAAPIPIEVIGRILGVETAAMPRFRAWSEAAMGSFLPDPTPAQQAAGKEAGEAIFDYLDAAMVARRAAPGDDLISDLLAVQAETGTLSDSEIRVNALNLLLGGNVTTTDLIASAIWLLLSNPEQLARLRAEPKLIAAAIEEALRLEPPTDGTQRIASRAMQIGRCPVREGQVVAAMLHAANRDPAVFKDPHRFDIGRKDGPHLAFGGGAHICIGAPLARLEAQVAVGAVLARFPAFAVGRT